MLSPTRLLYQVIHIAAYIWGIPSLQLLIYYEIKVNNPCCLFVEVLNSIEIDYTC